MDDPVWENWRNHLQTQVFRLCHHVSCLNSNQLNRSKSHGVQPMHRQRNFQTDRLLPWTSSANINIGCSFSEHLLNIIQFTIKLMVSFLILCPILAETSLDAHVWCISTTISGDKNTVQNIPHHPTIYIIWTYIESPNHRVCEFIIKCGFPYLFLKSWWETYSSWKLEPSRYVDLKLRYGHFHRYIYNLMVLYDIYIITRFKGIPYFQTNAYWTSAFFSEEHTGGKWMSSPLKIMSRALTHPNPHISKYPRSPTTTILYGCTAVRVVF